MIMSFYLIAAGLMHSWLKGILNISVGVHRYCGLSLTGKYIVALSGCTGRTGSLCCRIEQKILNVVMKKEKNRKK